MSKGQIELLSRKRIRVCDYASYRIFITRMYRREQTVEHNWPSRNRHYTLLSSAPSLDTTRPAFYRDLALIEGGIAAHVAKGFKVGEEEA